MPNDLQTQMALHVPNRMCSDDKRNFTIRASRCWQGCFVCAPRKEPPPSADRRGETATGRRSLPREESGVTKDNTTDISVKHLRATTATKTQGAEALCRATVTKAALPCDRVHIPHSGTGLGIRGPIPTGCREISVVFSKKQS